MGMGGREKGKWGLGLDRNCVGYGGLDGWGLLILILILICWVGLDWIGSLFDWIGLDWIYLVRFGLMLDIPNSSLLIVWC